MTTPDVPQPAAAPPTTEPRDIDFSSSVFYQPRAARVAAGAGPAEAVSTAEAVRPTVPTATPPSQFDQPQYPAPAPPQPAYPQPQYPQGSSVASQYPQPQYPQGSSVASQYPQLPYPQSQYPQSPYPQAQYPPNPFAQTAHPQAPYVTPQYPVRPPPRRQRSRSGVRIALVLTLLTGVVGGGYWLANRQIDTGSVASPDTKPLALPTPARPSLDTVTASPVPPVPSTAARGGGYLYRAKTFTVRLPHRPVVRIVPARSDVAIDKMVQVVDDQAGVEWARFKVTIPVSEQTSVLEGAVRGLGESGRLSTSNERITTFHGHPARLVTARTQDGTELTTRVAVYRPTHVLFIVAPSGRQFDLLAGSFTLRG